MHIVGCFLHGEEEGDGGGEDKTPEDHQEVKHTEAVVRENRVGGALVETQVFNEEQGEKAAHEEERAEEQVGVSEKRREVAIEILIQGEKKAQGQKKTY